MPASKMRSAGCQAGLPTLRSKDTELLAEGKHLGAELGVGAAAEQHEVDDKEDELVGEAEKHAGGTRPAGATIRRRSPPAPAPRFTSDRSWSGLIERASCGVRHTRTQVGAGRRTVSAMVRDCSAGRIPRLAVVGDRELEAGALAVRRADGASELVTRTPWRAKSAPGEVTAEPQPTLLLPTNENSSRMGQRISWWQVPKRVRSTVETSLGSVVVEVVAQDGGYSPAWRLGFASPTVGAPS